MGGLTTSVTRILLAIIACCIVGYALFAGRDYFKGPHVTLTPYPPRSTHEGSIVIAGHVRDVRDMTLNGAQVFYTSTQEFKEHRLLVPGENKFIIQARDTFNHTEDTSFSVYYSPPPPVVPTDETSLPSTALPTNELN